MLTAEQILANQKANLTTLFDLSQKAFEGVEKLVELNLQVAKTTLDEVSEPVVGVSRQAEGLLHPPSGRDLCVGIVAADDQDYSVKGEKPIQQRGERVAAIRRDQNGKNDYNRENFQKPGQPVFRSEAGSDQSAES